MDSPDFCKFHNISPKDQTPRKFELPDKIGFELPDKRGFEFVEKRIKKKGFLPPGQPPLIN